MRDHSDRIFTTASRSPLIRRAGWLLLPAAATLAAVTAMSALRSGPSAPEPVAAGGGTRMTLELALPSTASLLPPVPALATAPATPPQTLQPQPAAIEPPAPAPANLATPTATPAAEPAPAPAADPAGTIERGRWVSEKVGKGDTLSAIFSRNEISQGVLMGLVATGEPVKPLTRLRPGDRIDLHLDGRTLLEIRYPIDALKTLRIWREEERWASATDTKTLKALPRFAGGTIESSFFVSGQRAGLEDRLIMEVATIFGWDIDFALDIRTGDRFDVTYEELYADGESIGTGQILAASFTNQGRSFTAVRFTYPDGKTAYFAPDGRSMRKAFLRAPVDFRRISSTFRKERNHPVLGIKRPHRGVDYAAKTGTPIQAAGDGKVNFAGTKGGYGRTVILQHGGAYTTLYAHMSRIAPGMRSGKRVRQGQIIGYVGQSGTATGPHLHYEFRINGVHRNPLTVKLPKADPLPAEHKPAFREQSEPLLAQLALYARTQVAQAAN